MRRRATIGFLCAVMTFAGSGFCGDPPANIERATELYAKARALEEDAKWAQAEVLYQQAWDLHHGADIAANLADCEVHVGQWREAAEHFTYALANFPGAGVKEQKDALTNGLKDAKKHVGTLEITTNVPEASLQIDGHGVERTAFVDPGHHVITAQLTGYTTAQSDVTLREGESKPISLTLHRDPAPSVPNDDGSQHARPLWPAAVGFGLGAALLVGGVAFTAESNGKASDAAAAQAEIDRGGRPCGGGADPSTCQSLKDALGSKDSSRTTAIVGYAAGSALVVASAVWLLLPNGKAGKESSVGLTIAPSRRGSEVFFNGRF